MLVTSHSIVKEMGLKDHLFVEKTVKLINSSYWNKKIKKRIKYTNSLGVMMINYSDWTQCFEKYVMLKNQSTQKRANVMRRRSQLLKSQNSKTTPKSTPKSTTTSTTTTK